PTLLLRAQSVTLFPYTTLFRSFHFDSSGSGKSNESSAINAKMGPLFPCMSIESVSPRIGLSYKYSIKFVPLISVGSLSIATAARSEEHTSELQSRFDLVCRLLL